ncbi:hypothetical protein [Nostoc sp.]|uniref:hypothetical protein n=1 Tax=Nostoc sp. TaxID=1180 RepID=UPI002FF7E772
MEKARRGEIEKSRRVPQGTPNQIIILGDFNRKQASATFNYAWKMLTRTCQQWIVDQIKEEYQWRQEWELWTNQAWELFKVRVLAMSGES